MRVDRFLATGRLAAALILLGLAACAQMPRNALDPGDRSPAGGREALVIVPQGEIRADYDPSRVAAATAGGLIPALIDAGINRHRAGEAQTAITPLRDGLEGYDFDRRALSSARMTLLSMGWLGVSNVSFSKDPSDAGLGAFLDKSSAPEVLFITYDYALKPGFAALQVSASVTVLSKSAPAGAPLSARTELQNAKYHQVFRCIYPLAAPGKSLQDNAGRWNASGAAAARRALDMGLSCVDGLLGRSIGQTPAEASKLSQGTRITAGGVSGILIEKSSGGTLLLDSAGNWEFIAGSLTA